MGGARCRCARCVEGDEASFVLTTHDRHGNATYRASDHVVATVRPAAERGRLVSTPWDRRSSLPSHGPAPRGSYERPRGFTNEPLVSPTATQVQKSKESTARVVVFREFNLVNRCDFAATGFPYCESMYC